ncbi:HU family DNA-binding protein [Rhodospirillaceae bacterium SYSU D60014]|uniref:HU family DNA-binding protein n=1 Tax=Virgifigura deserti TaxID=2268457 RepID=UPI000E66EDBF
MNQKELIEKISKKTGWTAKDSKLALDAVTENIGAALAKGDTVRTAIGTFSMNKRPARTGRNPKTGESIKIKASKNVRFRLAKPIKDKLNKR